MGLRREIAKLIDNEIDSKPSSENGQIFYGKSFELAHKNNKTFFEVESPQAVKTTPDIPRVSKAELEAAYLKEPTMFNIVNKTVQVIMSAGYSLDGDDESVEFFTDFFASIGGRGGETDWVELLNSTFKHQLVYGEAWIELIGAKKDSDRIVDIDMIDPKKMDYAKDQEQKIVMDRNGNPVGYVETLPPMYSIAGKNRNPPSPVFLDGHQIFFPKDRIVHHKLYTVGDRFYGSGLVEPVYFTILRKMNMEQALANAVNRDGFPRKRVIVGDMNHEPTDEQVRSAVNEIKDMDYMGIIGHPYWVNVTIDEAKRPEKLQEHLDYYVDQIVSGSGVPKSLATGAGEDTNRATLNRQESLYKLALKDIVRRTLLKFQRGLIEPVAESNNVNPVIIKWGEISIEELDGKSNRLAKYVSANVLTPDEELERHIRHVEDLPEEFERIEPKQEPDPEPKGEKDKDDKEE